MQKMREQVRWACLLALHHPKKGEKIDVQMCEMQENRPEIG
jgi:hypothetical protein